MSGQTSAGGPTRTRSRTVVLALLAAAVVVAGIISFYASSAPDGLNRVAEDHGFIELEAANATDGSPLAGYATSGVEQERLSGGLAGVLGVTLTFLLGGGVFLAVRRRTSG